MSVDWDALLILGCKIDNPYVTVKKRGCHHQEMESKFCPECGKTMWQEEVTLSPVLEQFENQNKEGAIKLVKTCSGDRFYCGIVLGNVSRTVMDTKIDLDKFRKDSSEFFHRILKDLYRPHNFGLWLVMDAG